MEENICKECKATGKVIARTFHGDLKVDCSNCNGERFITDGLIKRKTAGSMFRILRLEAKVALRQISEATGYSIGELSNYEQGRKNEREVSLIKVAQRLAKYVEESFLEHRVIAITGSNQFLPNRKIIEKTKDYGEALKTKQFHQNQLFNGVSAVYEIESVRIFETPLDLSDVSDTEETK